MLGSLTSNAKCRYHIGLQRWLTPTERLVVHGWPLTLWAAAALGIEPSGAYAALSPGQQSSLAGNGMHMSCILPMVVFAALQNVGAGRQL